MACADLTLRLKQPKSLKRRIPSKDSLMDRSCIDSEFLRPSGDTLSTTVPNNDDIISFVSALFRTGRPATVAGFVGPIVVNSVDAVFGGGPFPHISQEVLETFQPTVTHSDAPPSVVLPTWPLSETASSHVAPSPIFWSDPSHSGSMSGSGPQSLGLKTTTRETLPAPQAIALNRYDLPTLTPAYPVDMSAAGVLLGGRFENRPTPEFLPRHFDEFCHRTECADDRELSQ